MLRQRAAKAAAAVALVVLLHLVARMVSVWVLLVIVMVIQQAQSLLLAELASVFAASAPLRTVLIVLYKVVFASPMEPSVRRAGTLAVTRM